MPGALKGEDIFCQITSVKKNFAEAELLSVNKASKFRVTPMCDIYETCGGLSNHAFEVWQAAGV